MADVKSTLTPAQAREKAEELFRSGYNCAQSVMGAFAEELGEDRETVLRFAQPFGAGLGRMREVCGTVSGMCMALGCVLGSADASDKKAKDSLYAAEQELAEKFRKVNGSIICRELLGLVPMGQSEKALAEGKSVEHKAQQPVSEVRTAEYYKKRPCEKLAGDAAEILAQWLTERAEQRERAADL